MAAEEIACAMFDDPRTEEYWQEHGSITGTVSTFPSGLFEYAEGGRAASIMPTFNEYDDRIDSVVWFPSRPKKWWLYYGVATLLGERAIRASQMFGQPLQLVETPADWVGAGPYAICILDWYADLRLLLAGAEELKGSRKLVRQIKKSVAEFALAGLPQLIVDG